MPSPAPLRALCALALATLAAAAPCSSRAQRAPALPLVVSPAWLAQHLDDSDLVVLHVGERHGFDAEHIPGARFVAMQDLARPRRDSTDLYLELAPPADLARQLEALGVSDRSRVVVYYGDDWVSPSTRVIFALDAAGFGARTALLDGGLRAWKRAGLPVNTRVVSIRRGHVTPTRTPAPVVDAAWMRAHERAPGVTLVDARAPVYYAGPGGHGERAGHIPGAESIPFTELVDDSLLVRPAEALRKAFADAGVQPGDTIAAYCHIGQQATAIVFAARLLGHPVRLYDGSFQDWSRRPELATDTARVVRGGGGR